MQVTIDKIGLVKSEGGYITLYLAVTATDGVQTITEDFVIGRQVIGHRIVMDARGWLKTTDGVYHDSMTLTPGTVYDWEYEPVVMDLKAEVLDVLKRTFVSRFAQQWRGDRVRVLREKYGALRSTGLPVAVRQLEGKEVTL